MSYGVTLAVNAVDIPTSQVSEIIIREEFMKARRFELHVLEEARAWALDESVQIDYGYGSPKTLKGRVDSIDKRGSLVILSGRDVAYETLDRVVDKEYSTTEAVAIMTDLIDTYAGGVLTYVNATASAVTINQIYPRRISMMDAFNKLILYAEDAGGDNFIWYLDEDKDLHTFAEGDVDNGRTLIWMLEVFDYRRLRDAWRTYDKVTVYGGLDTNGDLTSGSSGAGVRERVIIDEFLDSDTACGERAASELKKVSDRDVYALSCFFSSDGPVIGETVAVTLEPEGISAVDYIVYAVEDRLYTGVTVVEVGASILGLVDTFIGEHVLDEYMKQIKPKTVYAQQFMAQTHFFQNLALTNNSPGAGSVAWSAFKVQYNGTTYDVNAGDTANIYAWWDFSISTTVLQETDSPPSLTYQDALIFTNAAGIGSPVLNATVVNGAFIDALQIVGKDFRTAADVGDVGGPAGIRFNANEIAGYTGGVTKGFYILNDGKAYFAGGNAWFDAQGLTVQGDWITLRTATPGTVGYIQGHFDAVAGGDVIEIEGFLNKEVMVSTNDGIDTWRTWFTNAGEVKTTYDVIQPHIDGGTDLGTIGFQFGDIWGTVKYNDLHLLDVRCRRCEELFERNDDIKFVVTAVESLNDSAGTPYDQIRCIPVHVQCSLSARIKRWFNGLRMGN